MLDECQRISKPSSAVALAMKRIAVAAQPGRRIVISGTPIENSVGELWALFDFLMPGLLGSSATFRQAVTLPVARSRLLAATETDVAAASKALRGLHQRVLPFVLRRRKISVLPELPPKIIQDVDCTLSAVQRRYYAAIEKSTAARDAALSSGRDASTAPNALVRLERLRRLCFHPALVHQHVESRGDEEDMDDDDGEEGSGGSGSDSDDVGEARLAVRGGGERVWALKDSGKLLALRDLLCSCGFVDAAASADSNVDQSGVSSKHHRPIF